MKARTHALDFFFTPGGFQPDSPEKGLFPEQARLRKHFLEQPWPTLYQLGFGPLPQDASPSLQFLHSLAAAFVQALSRDPFLQVSRAETRIPLSPEQRNSLLDAVPFVPGSTWIDSGWLQHAWDQLNEAFARDLGNFSGTVDDYLKNRSGALRPADRIYFHLVENKRSETYPFAFLATYATFDANGEARHMPLSYALQEYRDDRDKLMQLLSSLDKVARVSPLHGRFITSGEIFHPFGLTSQEAYEFLKTIPQIEDLGIRCRIPNWWRQGKRQVSLSVKIGDQEKPLLGADTLLTLQPSLTVDGVSLTPEDIAKLLAGTEGLALIKGKWIEVDHKRLKELLQQLKGFSGTVTVAEALRQELSGQDEVTFTHGKWLTKLLDRLRHPETAAALDVPETVRATLRPYQKTGFSWLCTLSDYGFGMCLADDMGLGKTLEVLTYLARQQQKLPEGRFLLVVPASLLGNWSRELNRFTPSLSYTVLHGRTAKKLEEMLAASPAFLTLTTYALVPRLAGLQKISWDGVILDEAQAIKNPGTRQTRQIKELKARHRLAMTGTPVENDLSNLWSLFDFLDPGLLGSRKEFSTYAAGLAKDGNYGPLRAALSPFILRRLKTDKSIISDLPEKIEKNEYISLSPRQVALYRSEVSRFRTFLQEDKEVSGIKRKGLVLALLNKLKQICNHPDQFLGTGPYLETESGKFRRLGELCQSIYEKRERVLVFTQYREITDALSAFLTEVFGRPGFVIHGGVPVKKRQAMVDAFNGQDYVPYMVLSLKAAGTGLNLTSASHVIHFDRWWNPAVENQATDRAYRIGQTRNVIVHKFICAGTIEERIDALINSKKDLAEQVIGGSTAWITEFSDKELLDLVKLDLPEKRR